MKFISMFVALCTLFLSASATTFNEYFEPHTMRFDYTHAGNATTEHFYFNRLLKEGEWAGSKENLIDTLKYGNHLFRVIDKASGKEIYSRGYCSLFNEWQATAQAQQTDKAYPEAIVFPYPKAAVIVEFYSRAKADNNFVKLFSKEIDPASCQVVEAKAKGTAFDVEINGANNNCIDIVLVGEGYSTEERKKFENDCKVFAESLFAYTPFKERRESFNIRGVWCGDGFDSGASIPGEHIWRNTPLGAKFYTFDLERYQMIDDFQRVRDYAAAAPYDYVYILSNTDKYGGGGIYNMYALTSANHELTKQIYVHEFGHQMVGLGDEYVGGAAELYNIKTEPWEENLTTLVDFKTKRWSKMLNKSTPIPTEVNDKNANLLGVYEGGGYVAKGVYRPWINCIMNNLRQAEGFCPVCTSTLDDYILFLTK